MILIKNGISRLRIFLTKVGFICKMIIKKIIFLNKMDQNIIYKFCNTIIDLGITDLNKKT